MATETNLTRVNVFPTEAAYNREKSSLANTELSIIKLGDYFLSGLISQKNGNDSNNSTTLGEVFSWYRVYEDGWCEQGGYYKNDDRPTTCTITLPIPMKNTDYTILLSKGYPDATGSAKDSFVNNAHTITTTSFSYNGTYQGGSSGNGYEPTYWFVCGYKA